ncbi:MAG: hypothetical protein ACREDM_01915 [Methylocella sp.]
MSLSNRIEQAKDGTRVIGIDNAGIWKQLKTFIAQGMGRVITQESMRGWRETACG